MAPPSKRRRLFFWTEDELDNNTEPTLGGQALASPGFEHKVDQIESTLSRAEGAPILRLQQRRDVVLRQESLVVVQADVIVSVDIAITAGAASSTSTAAADTTTTAAASTSSSTFPEPAPTPAQGVVQSTTWTTVPTTTSAFLPSTQTMSTGLLSYTTSTNDLSSISSSISVISSAYTSAATSAAKNITVAGDILRGNLTLPSSSSQTSGLFPTSYSNSSIFSNTTASHSSTISSASSGTVSISTDASITLTTITTTGADGQPSTITTAVGAPIYSTPSTPPPSDATIPPDSGSSGPGPPPAGTIAGGVVGGAAGLAVLLLVAMLFMRWYRQRSKREHQALLPATHPDSDSANFVSRPPGMAESAGIRPLISAIPLLNRQQPSDGKGGGQTRGLGVGNDRGFQRLAGRKLPSAFSPGMDRQPPLPFAGQYRDSGASSIYPPTPVAQSNPFAHRPGSTSPEDNSDLGRQISDEQMTMLPGPQRRPTIHNTQVNLHVPGASSHARHVSSSARTSGLLA